MDDQNRDRGTNDRNYGRNRHHNNNNNRFHRPGGGGHHGGPRGRAQRPLLTSSINAAGMSLVALVLLYQGSRDQVALIQYMGWAVTLFGLSSLVSYIAQRLRPNFIEKISDYLFIGGVILVIWTAIGLSGIYTL